MHVFDFENKQKKVIEKYANGKINVLGIIFSSSRPDPWQREKFNLTFYFHTSLWCLKRFYEGLQGLNKTFWGTRMKGENQNLS